MKLKRLNQKDSFRRQNFYRLELLHRTLKCLSLETSLPNMLRFSLSYSLSFMAQQNSATRIRSRCLITGNSRSVVGIFKLCRQELKNQFKRGHLPYIQKAI